MPVAVKKVRWKCRQCGKSRWLKPNEARRRRYCSRQCHYEAMRVLEPVRALPSAKRTYGVRACVRCGNTYEAKSAHQKMCSQRCSTLHAQDRRRGLPLDSRPCEHCGETFVPRKGSAGRFCSWDCKIAGQRGSRASHYKGGRHVTKGGYVKVQAPGHPAAHGNGDYVNEHRLVMEEQLGRYLRDDENVHHRNGNKADNRPENLELWCTRQPKGQRVEDKIEYAIGILRDYAPDLLTEH